MILPAEKILSRSRVLERFGRPRHDRVVFTNGCFDLLHPGHVHYLDTARRMGDALVVALNTDASVRRLKGPSRPLAPEGDRALVVAALAAVDAVTLFDEDTPADLIGALLPDVLVKGGDYQAHEIVGAEAVIGAGGRVEVVPFQHGFSTTSMVDRICSIRGDSEL